MQKNFIRTPVTTVIMFLLCIFMNTIALATETGANTGATTEAKNEVKLPVVMYHLVTKNPKHIGKYGVTPDELEQDLAYLKSNNYNTVVMQDLLNFVNNGTPLPENPVM